MTDEPLQAPVAMTPADANAKLSGLVADQGFRDKLLSGNADARREMSDLNAVIATRGALADQAEAELLRLQVSADLPAEVVTMMREAQPVAAGEKVQAKHLKDSLMKDESWVKKYFSGDREAKRQMILINAILAAPEKQ